MKNVGLLLVTLVFAGAAGCGRSALPSTSSFGEGGVDGGGGRGPDAGTTVVPDGSGGSTMDANLGDGARPGMDGPIFPGRDGGFVMPDGGGGRTVARIEIAPAAPTIAVGTTVTFVVTAVFSDGGTADV